jgi:hypothetical protein
MLFLLEALQRFAQRRRRAGAGGLWAGIAFATFLMRLHKRRATPATLRETLEPGESLLITHTTQRRG